MLLFGFDLWLIRLCVCFGVWVCVIVVFEVLWWFDVGLVFACCWVVINSVVYVICFICVCNFDVCCIHYVCNWLFEHFLGGLGVCFDVDLAFTVVAFSVI